MQHGGVTPRWWLSSLRDTAVAVAGRLRVGRRAAAIKHTHTRPHECPRLRAVSNTEMRHRTCGVRGGRQPAGFSEAR